MKPAMETLIMTSPIPDSPAQAYWGKTGNSRRVHSLTPPLSEHLAVDDDSSVQPDNFLPLKIAAKTTP
jgi:hypothetical protein